MSVTRENIIANELRLKIEQFGTNFNILQWVKDNMKQDAVPLKTAEELAGKIWDITDNAEQWNSRHKFVDVIGKFLSPHILDLENISFEGMWKDDDVPGWIINRKFSITEIGFQTHYFKSESNKFKAIATGTKYQNFSTEQEAKSFCEAKAREHLQKHLQKVLDFIKELKK